MKIFIASLLPITLLSSLACAQTTLVLPSEYAPAWGRTSTSALGGSSSRTQFIFANPFQIGTVVTGFGLRAAATTVDRAAFTADIEIRVSSTAAVPGALSSTWANNIGNDEVIVLPRQIVNIPAMPANRGTGFFADIPFQVPFTFGLNSNTNICVDLLVYGRSAGAAWGTDRAFASASGRALNAGAGCGTATITSVSTGGTYVGGASVAVSLANAPATSLALLVPTFDLAQFVPGVPLPYPLQPFGTAAGCDLMVNPSLGSIAFVTDGAGAASSSLTLPVGLGQLGIGFQWIYNVPSSLSNPLGFETTGVRSIWVGPEVVTPNAQYVWDLSNVNNATGNATTNSVPVVRFTTL